MKKDKRVKKYSGIGGQAVMEGIMMRNQDRYAVAVRKPDGEIEVMTEDYKPYFGGAGWTKLPFVRGVFAFVDSLVLGMKCLSWSAEFFDDETEDGKAKDSDEKSAKDSDTDFLEEVLPAEDADDAGSASDDKPAEEHKADGGKAGKAESGLMTGLTVAFSLVAAVVIFMLTPYFMSRLLKHWIASDSLIALCEGVFRILIFVIYVAAISAMKDIRRVYMYHGAEHKCINCIERGYDLNVKNVMKASRLHRRCGTSFLLFVMLVSVIFFIIIRSDDPVLRVLIRIVLIPVIAGVSYELIRLAGRSENILVRILSAPGMALQRLTTREPDESMVEVAIAAVEAVFDWKQYLKETFRSDIEE